MRTEEFDYELPKELIAQYPVEPRDKARMMVLKRGSGEIIHSRFSELPSFLDEGDLIVANDTRVIPARIWGRKETGGRVEILLLRQRDGGEVWECLARKGRKIPPGTLLTFSSRLRGEILEDLPEGKKLIRFLSDGDFFRILKEVGHVPLPPYIRGGKDEDVDREAYQTVFARKEGAVAAPTAGLHFTPSLMERLKERGVKLSFLTLHTGWASFRPLRTERVEEHRLDEEYFEIPEETSEAIGETKRRGRRVIALGTTTTRALEEVASREGRVKATQGWASLYIYPGYRFKVIDALITNFHLPRSSLLVLVAAFASRGLIMKAYQEAVRRRYRFFSYGDGMLIL